MTQSSISRVCGKLDVGIISQQEMNFGGSGFTGNQSQGSGGQSRRLLRKNNSTRDSDKGGEREDRTTGRVSIEQNSTSNHLYEPQEKVGARQKEEEEIKAPSRHPSNQEGSFEQETLFPSQSVFQKKSSDEWNHDFVYSDQSPQIDCMEMVPSSRIYPRTPQSSKFKLKQPAAKREEMTEKSLPGTLVTNAERQDTPIRLNDEPQSSVIDFNSPLVIQKMNDMIDRRVKQAVFSRAQSFSIASPGDQIELNSLENKCFSKNRAEKVTKIQYFQFRLFFDFCLKINFLKEEGEESNFERGLGALDSYDHREVSQGAPGRGVRAQNLDFGRLGRRKGRPPSQSVTISKLNQDRIKTRDKSVGVKSGEYRRVERVLFEFIECKIETSNKIAPEMLLPDKHTAIAFRDLKNFMVVQDGVGYIMIENNEVFDVFQTESKPINH